MHHLLHTLHTIQIYVTCTNPFFIIGHNLPVFGAVISFVTIQLFWYILNIEAKTLILNNLYIHNIYIVYGSCITKGMDEIMHSNN